MILHGISIGISLFSLSYLLLFRSEQNYSKLASSIIAILGWLSSGVFWLEFSQLATHIYVASLPLAFFALVPLVYCYQKSLITEKSGQWLFSMKNLRELIPSAFALLLSLSILLMPASDFNALFFNDNAVLSTWSSINAAWFLIMLIGWFLLSCIYLICIIKNTQAYHRRLKNMFADDANKKLNWFSLFVGWMMFTWIYSCVVLVFNNALSDYYISESGVALFLLILNWIFCLHALQHKPAFAGLSIAGESNISESASGESNAAERNAGESIAEPEQYQRSAIDADRLQRIASKINQLVINDKAYLDAEINAVKLGKCLGISTHYLSQTLSQQMNTTFYDYINAARIEAAKVDLKLSNKTVLDIATEVGFNSRSSFYNAFKKITGMTPSEYRIQN